MKISLTTPSILGLIALACTCSPVVFAQETNDAPRERPERISEEFEREYAAILAKVRQDQATRRKEQKEFDEFLRAALLAQGTLDLKMPAPARILQLRKPTTDFLVQRGIAWLVSKQNLEGNWAAPLGVDRLAKLAVKSVRRDSMSSRVGWARLAIRETQQLRDATALLDRQPSLANYRVLAVTILARCSSGARWAQTLKNSDIRDACALLKKHAASIDKGDSEETSGAAARRNAIVWSLVACHAAVDADLLQFADLESLLAGVPVSRYAVERALLVATARPRASTRAEETRGEIRIEQLCKVLAKKPSSFDGPHDAEQLFLRMLILREAGGSDWNAWRIRARARIVQSVKPDGAWGAEDLTLADRILITALAVQCLETIDSP